MLSFNYCHHHVVAPIRTKKSRSHSHKSTAEKNYISFVTVTFLNSGLSKTRTCQPNNQPGSNTVEKSPSRRIILHWMNVGQNHLLVVKSWHRTLHFLQHRRTAARSLTAPFIYIAPNWLTGKWNLLRKEAHCLASVEKEEGCSKTTLVCWSTLSVSRNPDQLSFPASQDVDGVSCLTFRPFVDLSFDDLSFGRRRRTEWSKPSSLKAEQMRGVCLCARCPHAKK